MVSEAAKS